MKKPVVLCTFSGRNVPLARAFSSGCKSRIVDVQEFNAKSMPSIASYGVLRGTAECFKQAEEFWYMDHGYLGGSEDFWRVTKNEVIHSGRGQYPTDRLQQFNLKFEPWRKTGKYIVLSPPSAPQRKFLEIENWLENTILSIRKHTDKEIILSRKPLKHKNGKPKKLEALPEIAKSLRVIPFGEAVHDAWTVITDHSRVMNDALCLGVPIICTNRNRQIGSIESIESPEYIDREEFFAALSYNQWTLEEIRSGQAWRELNG